jgi:hypothetical protein
LESTHSQKLRDALKLLLAQELGEYVLMGSSGIAVGRSPAIRIVPPQVPDNIRFEVVDGRGIECLIYQDPRVEPSSMQPDFEYFEVAIRQHNLKQPTTQAKKLITTVFSAVQQVRRQQAQIQGEVTLEQVNFEIPRFYDFDGDYVGKKTVKLLS